MEVGCGNYVSSRQSWKSTFAWHRLEKQFPSASSWQTSLAITWTSACTRKWLTPGQHRYSSQAGSSEFWFGPKDELLVLGTEDPNSQVPLVHVAELPSVSLNGHMNLKNVICLIRCACVLNHAVRKPSIFCDILMSPNRCQVNLTPEVVPQFRFFFRGLLSYLNYLVWSGLSFFLCLA